MFVIGITGGIGTGKSTVARILADRGVLVLDADKISREVTESGGRALEEIRETLGNRVFDASGSLKRNQVAEIVFSNRTKLDQLSAVIHRHVLAEMAEKIEAERQKGTKVIALDVPIPVQRGFVDSCNQIWTVSAPLELRLDRLLLRGMTNEEAKRRMDMQMTAEEYEDIADFVIQNDQDMAHLETQVKELIEKELHKRGIRI